MELAKYRVFRVGKITIQVFVLFAMKQFESSHYVGRGTDSLEKSQELAD